MEIKTVNRRRRGRPPKNKEGLNETREILIRAGLEVLTEKGFSSAGIDEILKLVSVPKGSFYHYFSSKEEFGTVLINRYISFYSYKLEKNLNNGSQSPLKRFKAFIQDASDGMAKYNYTRGCLVGNLGQEVSIIPPDYRQLLKNGIEEWQRIIEANLQEAKKIGEISETANCKHLAQIFWIGWEGAVLRAKIERSSSPLNLFSEYFIGCIVK